MLTVVYYMLTLLPILTVVYTSEYGVGRRSLYEYILFLDGCAGYAGFRLTVVYAGFRLTVVYAGFRLTVVYAGFRVTVVYAGFRLTVVYAGFKTAEWG